MAKKILGTKLLEAMIPPGIKEASIRRAPPPGTTPGKEDDKTRQKLRNVANTLEHAARQAEDVAKDISWKWVDNADGTVPTREELEALLEELRGAQESISNTIDDLEEVAAWAAGAQ